MSRDRKDSITSSYWEFCSYRAEASSTTNNLSSGNSLKSKRLGAGGISSVIPEKRTNFCCFMWASASKNIIFSIEPVG